MVAISQNRKVCCADASRYIWKIIPALELIENDGSPVKDVAPYEYVICCSTLSNDLEIFAVYGSEETAKNVLDKFMDSMMYMGTYKFPDKMFAC